MKIHHERVCQMGVSNNLLKIQENTLHANKIILREIRSCGCDVIEQVHCKIKFNKKNFFFLWGGGGGGVGSQKDNRMSKGYLK